MKLKRGAETVVDFGGHAEWGWGPNPKSKEKTLKDSVRKEWYLESC